MKLLHQKKRRADVSDAAWIEDLEEESAKQEEKILRLQRQVLCLQGESAKREEDYSSLLKKTEDRVDLLKNKKRQTLKNRGASACVGRPYPPH